MKRCWRRAGSGANSKIKGLLFTPASAPAAWTPPSYAHPSSFHEQRFTVTSGKWKLPGTLTLPNGRGPFPAVVLVAGSGPEDQDETIGPNKDFKDLAWGLASQGIAVLRYPKRTEQYGAAAQTAGFTVMQEYVDDARAAVAQLAARHDIARGRIFVLGHSEGGTVAPRIASGDQQTAGLIILAGSTQPLAQAIVRQFAYLSTLPGQEGASARAALPALRKAAAEAASPSLRAGDTVSLLGVGIPGSYLLDLRGYHPAAAAAKLHTPMLILQGSRDYQVLASVDLAAWKRALAGQAQAPYLRRFFRRAGPRGACAASGRGGAGLGGAGAGEATAAGGSGLRSGSGGTVTATVTVTGGSSARSRSGGPYSASWRRLAHAIHATPMPNPASGIAAHHSVSQASTTPSASVITPSPISTYLTPSL